MRLKTFLVIGLVISAGIWLSGCCQKATEKIVEETTEKAIEESTNGQADVELNNNTVSINTNTGSYQAGENVDLPSGFPNDIYVVDGQITAAITATETNGYTISIETNKSVTELKTLYEQKLKDDGWTISLTMVYEGSASVGGEKDNRSVSVGINPGDEGKSIVVISTYTNTSD